MRITTLPAQSLSLESRLQVQVMHSREGLIVRGPRVELPTEDPHTPGSIKDSAVLRTRLKSGVHVHPS